MSSTGGWFGRLTDDWFLATELYDAFTSQDLDAFRNILVKGAHPNTILPEFGMSMIHMICSHTCLHHSDQFLDCVLNNCAGVDLNQKTSNGLTPLFLAIKNNRLSLAHKLLEAGADVRQMELCLDDYCSGNGDGKLRKSERDQWNGKSKTCFDFFKSLANRKDSGDCNPSLMQTSFLRIYPYHLSSQSGKVPPEAFDNALQNLKTTLQYCTNHAESKDRYIDEIDVLLEANGTGRQTECNRDQLDSRHDRAKRVKIKDIEETEDYETADEGEQDDESVQDSQPNAATLNAPCKRHQMSRTSPKAHNGNTIDFMNIIETEEFHEYLFNIIFSYRSSCQVYETCFTKGEKKKSKLTV